MSNFNKMAGFRAEQLCIMHFTRSNEIKLLGNLNDKFLYPNRDPNLDLLFDINDENFYKGYQFGVTLKAIKGPHEMINLLPNFKTFQYTKIVMPVLLVIFNIDLDKGYFAWINQPTMYRHFTTVGKVTPDRVQELNARGLKEIISKVSLYYRD
jgi:hypothetical protein